MLKKIIGVIIAVAFTLSISACTTVETKKDKERSNLFETVELQGSGGIIPVVIERPKLKEGEKAPVAIIMHGILANKEYPLITAIAKSLRGRGFITVRFDFNGHGEGYGDFVDMTVLKEVEDAKNVIAYIRSQPFTENINLVGHSQGGVVTSIVAGELNDSINSIVLLAPAAVLEDQTIAGYVLGIPFDQENIPNYVEVFGQKIGKDYILEAQNIHIYERAEGYKGPASIIHGREDFVVPFSYGEKYHNIYKGSEIHLLDGVGHEFKVDTGIAVKSTTDFLVNQQ